MLINVMGQTKRHVTPVRQHLSYLYRAHPIELRISEGSHCYEMDPLESFIILPWYIIIFYWGLIMMAIWGAGKLIDLSSLQLQTNRSIHKQEISFNKMMMRLRLVYLKFNKYLLD